MADNPRKPSGTSQTLSIYQIFIRNFTVEGTFRAAEDRLEEIAGMGFSWVYLTPIHPIGKEGRKGTLGSPYAIQDCRRVETALGSEEDFRRFIQRANQRGLRVMLDVVYNHTAPDSQLAREHPEWFLRDQRGKLSRKCDDWSDVVDLDYFSDHAASLRRELIDTLIHWRTLGVQGFRCDVASLVPVDFWVQARQMVDEAMGNREPTLWLAESVHPHFLLSMRDRGFGAWSEPELHRAFDLTYDYDGWERLEKVWSGEKGLDWYLDYLEVQRVLYPQGARKIRYLENHDQIRSARRFGQGKRLEAWTAFYQFIPGCTFVYMGQEEGIETYPSLFEKEAVPWNEGNGDFKRFFTACFSATQKIKEEADQFDFRILARGVVLLQRKGPQVHFTALCNLDDRSGKIELAVPLEGVDMLTEKRVALSGTVELPRGALILRKE
jgi:glycosidase